MSSYQITNVDQSNHEQMLMNEWDFVTIGLYFLLVIATGIYSSCKIDRNTVTGYFLAGRFMWWLPVGASLFASNIGSEHFIGLAGSGAAAGIYVGAFELNAPLLLQLMGWVFIPVYIASGVSTMPEYMYKRFGGKRIQTWLAVVSLLLYVFTKISVNIYSGAIFLQQAFRWTNLYISVCVLLGMTAILTIAGGLSAVIYTDTLQFFIMNLGSISVAIKAFRVVGGYQNMVRKYMTAIPDKLIENSTCGIPRSDSWVMLHSARPSEPDMPWLGFFLGQTPASIWYLCTDQVMVQRTLASRSLSHAKGATIFAGYAKLLPLFVIIMPGMISRILYPNEVGCVDPAECHRFCGADTCSNFAYPKLVFTLMPNGLRGVMLSVMLSALISDLTSIFNSASTLFTIDIWTLGRPLASEREKLIVGRTFILFLVAVSIVWIPVIELMQGGELFIYIQAVSAYLAPPIAAIYCLAILFKRINEVGAFWGLICGFVVGIVRMGVDFSFRRPPCHEMDLRPTFIKNFHYMYFAMILFWFTASVTVLVSWLTETPTKWRLIRTTFGTRHDNRERLDEIDPSSEKDEKEQYELMEATNNKDECLTEIELQCQEKNADSSSVNNEPVSKIEKTAESSVIARLETLRQKPWERKLLNAMFVQIAVVVVVLYAYYSVSPFSEEEIRQMQREKLKEIRNQTLWGDGVSSFISVDSGGQY